MTYEVLHHGQPLSQASKALILLHGRGGTAQGMLPLAEALSNDQFHLALPQAPSHAWYPKSFLVEEKLNEPFLSSAIDAVKQLIDSIAKSIPKEHIYIAGFSQGACLALEVAARYAAKYGGVIAFIGGLIGSRVDERKYRGNFQGTKIFIGNSDRDPFVPLERSEESKALLEKLGAQVMLKVYEGMEHTINADEIKWVRQHILLI